MTWVPPQGGPPVGPARSATGVTQPSAPEPAAPAGPAIASIVSKPDRTLRTAVLAGVIGGLVAGCLIGGVGTTISNSTRPPYGPYDPYPVDPGVPDPAPPSGDYSNLAIGDPGSPVAAEPTVCDTACFDESSAEAAILADDVFARWYMSTFKHVWKMTGDRTTAAESYQDEYDDWMGTAYSPDECYVTFNELPLVERPDADIADGLIAPLTEHTSDSSYVTELTQWVRLFPDSASAEQYMATLDAGLDVCTRYHDPNGYAIDAVTLEPALQQPDNVAAIGFVRSQGGIRYYVFDLQRGNMVIRSVAYSDGGISDDWFRPLMAQQAVLLGELELVGGGVAP